MNTRQRKRARRKSRTVLVAAYRGKLYPPYVICRHGTWRHARLRRIPHGDIALRALGLNYLGTYAQGRVKP